MSRPKHLRPRTRKAVAALLSIATGVTYTGLSLPGAPANAAPNGETASVIALFDGLKTFVPGLAGVGALGKSIPTLGVAPGSDQALGLSDLMTKTVDKLDDPGKPFATSTTPSDLWSSLSSFNQDVGGGRTVTFQVANVADSNAKRITLHVAKTVTGASLDIADDAPLAPGYPPLSLTSSGGASVTLGLDLAFVAHYVPNGSSAAWITEPALALTGSAAFATPLNVPAGLGVLGVKLGNGSTLALQGLTINGAFRDPNNDGKLYFDEPGGTPGVMDGELAAAGAGPGLVTASVTGGTVDAHLVIEPTSSTEFDLPAINAVVDVHGDLTQPGYDVSFDSHAFDTVRGFLTLTTRDLAQGLASAASSVLSLQNATQAKLPFMRGDYASAIGAVQSIVKYLEQAVPPADGVTHQGLPEFSSIQDLLTKLEAFDDIDDLSVGDATYDAATKKLRFALDISRAAGDGALDLNPSGAPVTGTTATYTATTLVDNSKTFPSTLAGRQVNAGTSSAVILSASDHTLTLDPEPVTPAGGSAPAVLWVGGTPAMNTPYSIAAGDQKVGAVELANALSDKANGAVKNANAKVAIAKVTPSFDLHLPLVLDLRDPTADDCDPGTGTAACPFKYVHNGITQIVSSLPLTADRVQLDVGGFSLTADAPITTKVDIDATVGFLGVKLVGDLVSCTRQDDSDTKCTADPSDSVHLLTLSLKESAFDPSYGGDVPFRALIDVLGDAITAKHPEQVVDFAVKARAYAKVSVTVPGQDAFFGGLDTGAEVFLDDLTAPDDVDVQPFGSIASLGSFDLKADDPLALFGIILSNLGTLEGVVGDLPGAGALDTQIPVVGKSFSELIGSGASGSGEKVSYAAVDPVAAVPATPSTAGTPAVPAMTKLTDTGKAFDSSYVGRTVRVGSQQAVVVSQTATTLTVKPAINPLPTAGAAYTTDSELQGLITSLEGRASTTLQDLVATLAAKLGPGSAATFDVLPGTAPQPDRLRLNIDWKRHFADQIPLDLKFQLPVVGDQQLLGAQGSGTIKTTLDGEIKVALLIPLDPSTIANPGDAVRIDPTKTLVTAKATVDGDGAQLAANLGPFKVKLGDGTASGTKLRADLGVRLDAGSGGPVPVTDLVKNLHLSLTTDGVDCGVSGGSTPLAVCAKLPMTINDEMAGSTADKSNLVVRLPKVGDDLVATLNPLGPDVDGKKRVETPDELANKIAQAALNLLSFGDGFAGYLEFAEKALRVGSFDGKLPLVGKDLQAGADFLGQVRTQVDAVFASTTDPVPTDTTAGAIRTFVTEKVKPKLPDTGNTFQLDVTCTTPLPAAAAPTFGEHGAAGSETSDYTYKIVAHTLVYPGTNANTATGAPSTKTWAKTLNGTNYLDVSWPVVPRANGYLVLRKTGNGAFTQIADVPQPADPATTVTYSDQSSAAGSTPPAEVPVEQAPCPDATPAAEVTGFFVKVSIGRGLPDATVGCKDNAAIADATQKTCISTTIPVDFGIPGLSLHATDDTGGITAAVGWRLDLKLAFTRADGFYVDDQGAGVPEFSVGLKVTLPSSLRAQVAFLNVDATDNDAATPEFAGLFEVNLEDAGDHKLGLDQILSPEISDLVKVKLLAKVNLQLHLSASVDSAAALPGIEADFHLTWNWDPGHTAPSDDSGLAISFDHVMLNLHEFLSGTIKPVIEAVVKVFKPVQPVIDTLYERVPVLSDLAEAVGGDPITIASLAQTFSTLADGPDLQPFLDVLKNIRDLLKALDGQCPNGQDVCIDIGALTLDKKEALAKENNPSTAGSILKTFDDKPSVVGQVNSNSASPIDQSASNATHPGFSFPFLEQPARILKLLVGQDVDLIKFDSGPLTLGFDFQESFGPVYAPPPVNIVVGGGASVTMRVVAGFDTYGIRTAVEKGKFDAGILDSLFFYTADEQTGTPIPVVQFQGYLQAGASLNLFVVEVGVVGGVKLTINFYWNDPNNDGRFRFSEFLTTALSNPICLFNVGGELSLFIKVFIKVGVGPFSTSFDFELVNVVLLEFNLKPNCTPPPPKLGGVKGSTLYLFGGKLGDHTHRAPGYGSSYPLTNHGEADEEKWVVRQYREVPETPARPNTTEENGKYKDAPPQPAKKAEPAKIVVTALGISETFPDPGGNTIQNVVWDSSPTATGKISLTFNGGDKDTPFTKALTVRTGSGADVIRAGVGAASIDAGGGADQVTTLERTDLTKSVESSPSVLVSGGGGPDVITVGNGHDTVLGDKALAFGTGSGSVVTADDPDTAVNESTKTGPVAFADIITPGSGSLPADPDEDSGDGDADQISAGLGGTTVYGNEGGDRIGTANDNPQADLVTGDAKKLYQARANFIAGGNGADRIKSGSGDDTVFTGLLPDDVNAVGEDDPGLGDADPSPPAPPVVNAVDTGTGSDKVYGSPAKDFITTHSTAAQSVQAYGGGNADVIIGGLGTDKLFGGPGDDYLTAGPATVGEVNTAVDELGSSRQVVEAPSDGVANEKLLVGGGGSDRIYGVDGPAEIYGDHRAVTGGVTTNKCVAQTDPASKQPGEGEVNTDGTENADGRDLILGGAKVDTVNAGGQGDFVRAFGDKDVLCGSAGDDVINGGDDDDLVLAGSGDDKAYGDKGADQVYGNTGADSLFGNLDKDRVQGGPGKDFASGGEDDDLVIGGTSKAGTPDDDDQVYGDTGNDVLVGDNSLGDTAATAYPADLASAVATIAGTDYVYGGDGDDKAYGGLEDDWVYGGKNDDDLEGNGGSDHVYGELGSDDLIGGSSEKAGVVSGQDVGRPDVDDDLYGGEGDDVITGDNAVVTRTAPFTATTQNRSGVSARGIQPLDLGRVPAPASANSGGDRIFGESGPDVILGQGGEDAISGGEGDDYAEGDQAKDVITGDGGQDDLVGGSSYVQSGTAGQPWTRTGQLDTGDEIDGGDGQDVVLGDNGVVLRGVPASDITKNRGGMDERLVDPYDLGDSLTPGTSGADYLLGQGESDVILGQRGTDRIAGHAGQDYLEGGPESDWVEGGSGDDDLVGGSSAPLSGAESPDALGQPDDDDWLWAQDGDDVAVGDNAAISRVEPFDPLTYRIGTNPVKERTEGRYLRLRDRVNSGSLLLADPNRAGADFLSGQAGVDVLLGQDENDQIAGGGADDYLEGQGGADRLFGDWFLSAAATPYAKSWPKDPTLGYGADGTPDGQDEVVGGKSEKKFRDGDDYIEGNGESDFVLGDNGSVQRDTQGPANALVDRAYALKYDPSKPLPVNAAKVRLAAGSNPSTRFCDEQQATCEPVNAFGADQIYGQGGDDFLYGQDGGDTIRGGTEDDDIYGELGEDFLFGEQGRDAIVGDRGGVVDTFETGARERSIEVTSVPKVVHRRFTAGSVTRVTDLAHDVNGDVRVNGTFPWDGLRKGDRDEIRGGSGDDRIHAGLGDDLVNGDSGGDALFGDDGADVMWGGKGCDQQLPKAEQDKACFDPLSGVFQAAPHEAGGNGKRQGETVPGVTDYLIGGTGGDPGNGLLGADILDWNPRGSYSSPGTDTTCTDDRFPKDVLATNKKAVTGTIDPCAWFRMTNKDTATPDDDQYHQGIDWQYGGWDRDVMQANEADNGPNEGDRLLDWNGAYNLYTHCNPAYGGYNDVRLHSPDWQSFLQLWVYGLGAGYGVGPDAPESATSGTAAFREVAIVYPGSDNDHGSGTAFPGTPGHFDANAGCPAS